MNKPSSRVHHLFCFIILISAGGLVLASVLVHSVNLPGSRFRLESATLRTGGLLIALMGFTAFYWSTKYAAALATALIGILIVSLLGYRSLREGDFSLSWGGSARFRVWQSDTEWTDIYARPDAQFGWRGIPGQTARQEHRDFSVTYTLDNDGWRRQPTPSPEQDAPEIWFVGCSCTFGVGVNDRETYAHLLAAKAWPDVRVRNFSTSGWGTTNCYLVLKDRLANLHRPSCVFYGWIDHHRKRNYLRRSWFTTAQFQLIPHFELDEDKLRFVGIVPGKQATVEDGPELDRMENKLSVKLVQNMNELCRKNGVKFVLLVLQQSEETKVLDELRQDPSLALIDVSKVSHSTHPNDRHPTAAWHQAVAHTIAAQPFPAELTGMPRLCRPAAIDDTPMRGWFLSLDYFGSDKAQIRYPLRADQPLRVHSLATPSVDIWKILLIHANFGLVKGKKYMLTFRVRADGPRKIEYAVVQGHPPWDNLGLWGQADLTTDWQTVHRTFSATMDEADARLTMVLGGNTQSVEFMEPHLVDQDGNELLRAPPANARPASIGPVP